MALLALSALTILFTPIGSFKSQFDSEHLSFLVLTPDFFHYNSRNFPFKNLSELAVNQTEFINVTMQLPK